MANVPDDLNYTPTHEWVRVDGDVATIGISDHAQAELGDITYVDLPEQGRFLQADGQFGEIESVKAVSELFSPVSGEVTETNSEVADATELLNEDPYGRGWLIKVRLSEPSQLGSLLSASDYTKLLGEGVH